MNLELLCLHKHNKDLLEFWTPNTCNAGAAGMLPCIAYGCGAHSDRAAHGMLQSSVTSDLNKAGMRQAFLHVFCMLWDGLYHSID